MTATATPFAGLGQLDTTQSTQISRGTVVLTGSYVTITGDTLNLAVAKSKVQSAHAPIRVFFTEQPTASVAPSGYILYYQAGTGPTNGKIRITSSAGTELGSGAYPAALLAALIQYEAVFTLGI